MNNLIEQKASEVASLLVKFDREEILKKAVIQIRSKGLEQRLKERIKKARKELNWDRLNSESEATDALIAQIKISK